MNAAQPNTTFRIGLRWGGNTRTAELITAADLTAALSVITARYAGQHFTIASVSAPKNLNR